MPFGRKIRLTACEMPAGVSGFILFHFTLRLAAKFHNSSELFHIVRKPDISLFIVRKALLKVALQSNKHIKKSMLLSILFFYCCFQNL